MKNVSKPGIRTAMLTLAAWGLFLPLLSFSDQTWEPIEELFLEAQPSLNRDVYVKGQQAPASGIKCTPDTVFFSPTGPYNSGETSNTNLPGYELNQNKTWTGISGISNVGQQLVWPLLPLHTGLVNIEAYIEVSSSQAGAEVRVQLGDLDTVVTTVESDGTTPQPWGLTASVTNAGVAISAVQNFKLIFETPSPSSSYLGTVRSVSLTGAGMIDCYMLRARWRPLAAHCSFIAEDMPSGTYVTRWIMEERPDFLPSADVPDPASHYSPLTTPFGYFGSVFTPDPETPENDFTVSSPNFSMWHDRTDPVEKLAHLIAIGTTAGEGIFGGFSHEGTGVKPKDMAPAFDGPQTSAVYSMGYIPPQAGSVHPYHTYVGHTYDAVSQQWKMYAAGRLYASSFNEIKADTPSSFVEVPGAGATQRTGQIKRTMDYRGWVLASNGQWYPLATISSNDPSTVDPLSKEFIASPDGWMRMTMGGMLHYLHYDESQVTNVGTFPPQDFMETDKLDDMANNWGVVTLEESIRYTAGQLMLSFTLSHPGTVNLFYGSSEGSTLIFEDGNTTNYWDSKYELGYFEAGSYTNYAVAAPGISSKGYCRLQVDSPTAAVGRFWSLEERSWNHVLTTVVQEPFTYDDAPVEGLDGGIGWAAAWDAGNTDGSTRRFDVIGNEAIYHGAGTGSLYTSQNRGFASAIAVGAANTVTVAFDLIRPETQSGRGIGIYLTNGGTNRFFLGKRINGGVGLYSSMTTSGTEYAKFGSSGTRETITVDITYDGANTSMVLSDSDETLTAYTFAGQLVFDGISLAAYNSATVANGVDELSVAIATDPYVVDALVWTDAGPGHGTADATNWLDTVTDTYPLKTPGGAGLALYYSGGVLITNAAACNGDLLVGGNALVINGVGDRMVDGALSGSGTVDVTAAHLEKSHVAGAAITLNAAAVLLLTDGGNPLDGATVDLNSSTASLRFKDETFAAFTNEHIGKVTMFGAALEFGADPFVEESGDNAIAANYNAPNGVAISYADGTLLPPFCIHEDFDGAALGASVNGTGSGTGWSGNWTRYGGTVDATTFKANSSFSDGTASVAASGLSAGLSGGEDLQRSLFSAVTVGSGTNEYPEVWLSFLIDSSAGNAVGHEYRVILNGGGAEEVSFGKQINAGWNLTTATTNVTFASSGASVGNFLAVVKLAFDGTDTVITGYLAKDSDAGLDLTDVSTFLLTDSVTHPGNMVVDTVRIRAHNTSTTTIDEIRLADTYLASIGLGGTSPQEPIGSISFAGPLAGGLGLSWDTTFGQIYNVETNVDLVDPLWGVYETVVGDGGGATVTTAVEQAILFYKVTTP